MGLLKSREASLLPLYKSRIRHAGEYGCPLCTSAPKTLLTPLEKTLNRENRVGCASTHVLLQLLNEKLDVVSMAFSYKYMNFFFADKLFCIVVPLFQPLIQKRRQTAWSNYVKEDTPRTKYLRNAFNRCFTYIWNDPPGDIIRANPPFDFFKKRFKTHLKPRCFGTR